MLSANYFTKLMHMCSGLNAIQNWFLYRRSICWLRFTRMSRKGYRPLSSGSQITPTAWVQTTTL